MADLQTLINAIPDANDGNIISSDYHNTIKAALQAIATELGGGAASQTANVTVQPNFLVAAGGGAAWTVSLGLATSVAGSNGFIALNLPDGATIQSMEIWGKQISPPSPAFANLLALPIAGTTSTTLIKVDFSTAGNPFDLVGTPSPDVSGLSASALQSMLTVQNSQFKYAIQAEALGAGIVINALQIVLSTSS
jgi:hypothetical protein